MCEVYVTFLTENQLQRMHATEGGYDFVAFPCELQLEGFDSHPLNTCHNYFARQGCVALESDGAARNQVGLAEVQASNRTFFSLGQAEMQAAVQKLLGCKKQTVEEFIDENIGNQEIRLARISKISETAVDTALPGATVVSKLHGASNVA